jgi:hypothetical protein
MCLRFRERLLRSRLYSASHRIVPCSLKNRLKMVPNGATAVTLLAETLHGAALEAVRHGRRLSRGGPAGGNLGEVRRPAVGGESGLCTPLGG